MNKQKLEEKITQEFQDIIDNDMDVFEDEFRHINDGLELDTYVYDTLDDEGFDMTAFPRMSDTRHVDCDLVVSSGYTAEQWMTMFLNDHDEYYDASDDDLDGLFGDQFNFIDYMRNHDEEGLRIEIIIRESADEYRNRRPSYHTFVHEFITHYDKEDFIDFAESENGIVSDQLKETAVEIGFPRDAVIDAIDRGEFDYEVDSVDFIPSLENIAENVYYANMEDEDVDMRAYFEYGYHYHELLDHAEFKFRIGSEPEDFDEDEE